MNSKFNIEMGWSLIVYRSHQRTSAILEVINRVVSKIILDPFAVNWQCYLHKALGAFISRNRSLQCTFSNYIIWPMAKKERCPPPISAAKIALRMKTLNEMALKQTRQVCPDTPDPWEDGSFPYSWHTWYSIVYPILRLKCLLHF